MISQAIHTLDLALQFTGEVTDVIALTATAYASARINKPVELPLTAYHPSYEGWGPN